MVTGSQYLCLFDSNGDWVTGIVMVTDGTLILFTIVMVTDGTVSQMVTGGIVMVTDSDSDRVGQ